MGNFNISLMECSDIHESVTVLSLAMLNNPLHIAVFQINGEKERLEIEGMISELLGIPTVSDRVAQMVVKQRLETELEPCLYPDSYGCELIRNLSFQISSF